MFDSNAFIPIAKPYMDEREAEAARRAILSAWVSQGPEVAAFERDFAAAVGAKHACAVSSATAALHLALRAVGVRPGDEVITVSHSFIATSNSIRHCGAKPVFVDIQPGTYNIDPAFIEAATTSRTRAILCVHQMGMPCDLAAVLKIAGRYALPLVEDAACALGSEIKVDGHWQKIGKPQGDVACFSFHPRKIITTGEGGMLTTAHPDYDKKFRLWRQNGMSISDTQRHRTPEVIFESYPELGFNYRMTDIQAAIGREQLKRLPELIGRRRYLADRYQKGLGDVLGLSLPETPAWAKTNWQSYCVRLPDDCDQKGLMQAMLDSGIASRRGIMCAHREAACQEDIQVCGSLLESEAAQDHCILLPLYPSMTACEQDRVIALVKHVLQKNAPL